LTWEENWKLLSIQDAVFGEQNRRLVRIGNKVDVIVTDTSLLFSLVYRREGLTKEFEDYVMSVYNSYNNLNINLIRNETTKYENLGRKETEVEALEVDNIVKHIIAQHKINYINITPGNEAINNIVKMILGKFNKQMNYRVEEL